MSNDDKNLAMAIWGDIDIEARFSNNPYSLTSEELSCLKKYEKFIILLGCI